MHYGTTVTCPLLPFWKQVDNVKLECTEIQVYCVMPFENVASFGLIAWFEDLSLPHSIHTGPRPISLARSTHE